MQGEFLHLAFYQGCLSETPEKKRLDEENTKNEKEKQPVEFSLKHWIAAFLEPSNGNTKSAGTYPRHDNHDSKYDSH